VSKVVRVDEFDVSRTWHWLGRQDAAQWKNCLGHLFPVRALQIHKLFIMSEQDSRVLYNGQVHKGRKRYAGRFAVGTLQWPRGISRAMRDECDGIGSRKFTQGTRQLLVANLEQPHGARELFDWTQEGEDFVDA
jgi:hypothetical protein